MRPIFHIADAVLWDAALSVGRYTQSTRDRTLEEVGFIHCSYAHQVDGVARAFYADVTTPHVVLTIAPDQLSARLQEDDGFPHIYGPLNTDAVTHVDPLHA